MHVCLAALLALSASATAAEPAPPELRLPETVRPLRQAVDLTLDPQAESLTGTTEIALDVLEAVPLVWVNARGLDLTEASLDTGSGPAAAQIVPGGDDFVGFSLAEPLSPGPVTLRVGFEAPISRRELSGVFTMEEAGDRYLFTQFQAIAARQAFPCFDEPSAKIPWRVTLRVPPGLVALANAPAEETRQEQGLVVVTFRETPPLPSSLVAFAVGPFELVDLGRIGRNLTPSRLVVPRGRGGDTAWAAATTPRILGLLEDYFDRAYPYAKLDQVTIPGVGFAMEHPGLVTYGQGLVVQRPAEETLANRRDWVVYCAHELAHMWFGNLVTMEWWDDTWLNEAFAMWMELRIADELRPEWGMDLQRVRDRSVALEADSLSTARRIRQPIETRHDIRGAFDGITYYKGKAVLDMIEAWLGEGVFRRGVNAYLARHAWGNATARDLIEEFSRAAGRDVAPTFSSFLDQVGVPVISGALACGDAPELVLEQRPYRPLGSPGGSQERAWRVPVCTAWAFEDPRRRGCHLLDEPREAMPLGEAGCPDQVLLNDGMRGYYRLAVDRDGARGLLESGGLSPAERLGLANDLEALVASGELPAGAAFELVEVLARDAHPDVVGAAADLLDSLESVVPDTAMGTYAAFVRRVFGPRARELGWRAEEGEDGGVVLLRPRVLRVVGVDGHDERLGGEAVALARGWLQGDAGPDPDVLDAILAVAARHADRDLFDTMMATAREEPDRQKRSRVLGALGEVRDPVLAREALGLLLEEGVDPRETFALAGGLSRGRRTRAVLWDFMQESWAAVTGRLPRSALAYLPYLARRTCDPGRRSALEAFLEPRVADVDGGPRSLEQALEQVDQCIARREVQSESAAGFLGHGVDGSTLSP